MKRGGTHAWVLILLTSCLVMTAGCSTGGTNGSSEEPVPPPDPTGVWLGWFGIYGNDFAVGIITEGDTDEYSARMIRSDSQFISPEDQFLTITENTVFMTGYLDQMVWTGSPPYYGTTYDPGEPLRIQMLVPVATRQMIGGSLFPGGYWYYGEKFVYTMDLFYSKDYDVSPNVNNLTGEWVIEDALQNGNDIYLIIENAVVANTTTANVSGTDDLGNTLTGTIDIPMEIRYSPTPHNIYDVNLTLNGSIDLEGLATYVLEYDSAGIQIKAKTLAIGANNSSRTYSVSGLALERK